MPRRLSHGSRETWPRAACSGIRVRPQRKKERAGSIRRPQSWPRRSRRCSASHLRCLPERLACTRRNINQMPPSDDKPALIDLGSGVSLERGVRCRTSDGVHLVSDHYYPYGLGPNPTLLMRQPYGRDIASTVTYAHPVWFASHGYNVVIQDVRGRGDSEGDFYPFRHEARDGAETIRWLRARSESNGKVGMYGFSYQGLTQLLAAAEQPEGLVCIAPAMTACDLYSGWFYQGGALRLSSTLGWGLQMLKEDA